MGGPRNLLTVGKFFRTPLRLLLAVIALPARIAFLCFGEVSPPKLIIDDPRDGVLPTWQREPLDLKREFVCLTDLIAMMPIEHDVVIGQTTIGSRQPSAS